MVTKICNCRFQLTTDRQRELACVGGGQQGLTGVVKVLGLYDDIVCVQSFIVHVISSVLIGQIEQNLPHKQTQTETKTDTQTYRQTDTKTDTDRQTDTTTYRQTDTKTDRQTHTQGAYTHTRVRVPARIRFAGPGCQKPVRG